jgi:ABC-type sugar transport system ATPase subunit
VARIDVRNVTNQYGHDKSRVTALKEVDLEIRDKEMVTLVGASGCGKSTLLHLIGGFAARDLRWGD